MTGVLSALPRLSNQWSASDKARWLAELARAIDEAQQVVWRLLREHGDNSRASELYGQLEAARQEVQQLQGGVARAARLEFGPEWTEIAALARAASDEAAVQSPSGSSPPPPNGCK